jgi:hypothetical protein
MELGHRAGDRGGPHRAATGPASLAQMLFGAICEIAMVTTRASDQTTALAEAAGELRRLLAALTVTQS